MDQQNASTSFKSPRQRPIELAWNAGSVGDETHLAEACSLRTKFITKMAGEGVWDSKKSPASRPLSSLTALTSHVFDGAIKHKVEERVKPFQDSTGLWELPKREMEKHKINSCLGSRYQMQLNCMH